MAAGGRQRDVGVAPDRVDRAVAGGDAGQRRLHLPHRHLVAPVGALEVVALPVREADLAADIADGRVAEGLDQVPQRAPLPGAVRVGEGEEIAGRALGGGVLGDHLAAPRKVEHEVGPGRLGPVDGRVGRAVGGDDQLEPLARIVERQRVGDLRRDHLRLVVGGDDQGDLGKLGQSLPWAVSPEADQERQCQRVADVRVGDQAGAEPEEDCDGDHRVASSSSSYRESVWRATASHEWGPAAARNARSLAQLAPRSLVGDQLGEGRRQCVGVPGGTRRAAPVAATSGKPPTALSTIGLPKARPV